MEEKKKVNVLAILLFILLLASVGYIVYDKVFTKEKAYTKDEGTCSTTKEETPEEVKESKYNKDGIFINDLMEGVEQSNIGNFSYELYSADKVTADDLSDAYRSQMIVKRLNNGFTKGDYEKASKILFGKIYTPGNTINTLCASYELQGNIYVMTGGGCGGTRLVDIKKITKVENDTNHIYVYQKVGFQCVDKICKNLNNTNGKLEAVDELSEIDFMADINVLVEKVADQLHEYKFTFTYDTENNLYCFESVERVS